MENNKEVSEKKQCDIHVVISRLEKLQRFDLDTYLSEDGFSVETVRDNRLDGDYIEAYDIKLLIKQLKNGS